MSLLSKFNKATKARKHESGQTTLEFALVWPVIAMLIFGGLFLMWGMVQVAMADYSIGRAEWATELDPEMAEADPASAIEAAIVERAPLLDGHIEVTDASIAEEIPSASIESWEASEEDKELYKLERVDKTPTVRHVKATVTYDIWAIVPFTDITGMTRTLSIDRDVVTTNDFRLTFSGER